MAKEKAKLETTLETKKKNTWDRSSIRTSSERRQRTDERRSWGCTGTGTGGGSAHVREAALELLLVSQLLQPRPVCVGGRVGEGQLAADGAHPRRYASCALCSEIRRGRGVRGRGCALQPTATDRMRRLSQLGRQVDGVSAASW